MNNNGKISIFSPKLRDLFFSFLIIIGLGVCIAYVVSIIIQQWKRGMTLKDILPGIIVGGFFLGGEGYFLFWVFNFCSIYITNSKVIVSWLFRKKHEEFDLNKKKIVIEIVRRREADVGFVVRYKVLIFERVTGVLEKCISIPRLEEEAIQWWENGGSLIEIVYKGDWKTRA